MFRLPYIDYVYIIYMYRRFFLQQPLQFSTLILRLAALPMTTVYVLRPLNKGQMGEDFVRGEEVFHM